MFRKIVFSVVPNGFNNFSFGMLFSIIFHGTIFIATIFALPFVDVMLVLLIIFMVTAPLLTVGVQVDLPETSADTLPEESEPLTLTINSKGEVFIQETKIEFDNLIKKILAVSNNRTDTRIYVRGDKTINYGRVLEVMGKLSGSGFTKVALISEPYKER